MIDDQIHSIYMEQGSSKKFNDDFIIELCLLVLLFIVSSSSGFHFMSGFHMCVFNYVAYHDAISWFFAEKIDSDEK